MKWGLNILPYYTHLGLVSVLEPILLMSLLLPLELLGNCSTYYTYRPSRTFEKTPGTYFMHLKISGTFCVIY